MDVALPWTTDEIAVIKAASDGYKVTVKLTLEEDSDYDTGSWNAMCFGVTPDLNGGFCIWWVGTGILADMEILLGGMGVQWIPYEYWSSAVWPTNDVGSSLSGPTVGLSMEPIVTGTNGGTNSLATGAEIRASWY